MIPTGWMLAGGLAGCIVVGAGGFFGGVRYESALRDAAIAEAVQAEAERFQTIVEDQQEITRHAKKAAEAARTDARAGELHARQLRGQLAAIREKYSAAACGGDAAGDAIGVLADVLERADERARILAEHADAARTAGQACERAYQAVRGEGP